MRVDAAQYCNWSREIFAQMRQADLTAVVATLTYHGTLRAVVDEVMAWSDRFRDNADLIFHGRSAADLDRAREEGRTAIFFGLQNPMPMEDDLRLLEILHALGVTSFQITYNTQSLLGCGWTEPRDSGLTLMGREVVREMNRIGMLIDLSHAGERTAIEAIEASQRPVIISHANPIWWRETKRNVSDTLLEALAAKEGMIGLSLYPHHMKSGSDTTLAEFCGMAVKLSERIGITRIGIGSDLCQDQPDAVVNWMREGHWMRPAPNSVRAKFPRQPDWFSDCRGFNQIAEGLRTEGLSADQVRAVLGENWARFFKQALKPQAQ
jgi:microsomal dipeptidase-like Zn-dependent dipeptidase